MRKSLMAIAAFLILLSFDTTAAAIKAAWKADAIANSSDSTTPLLDKENQLVATVNVERVRLLAATLSKIQKAANITSELSLVQLADSKPNAFAYIKDGTNHVGVSLSMLDLLGDDADAYAFLMGHEIAHNVKAHSTNSQYRKGFLQALSLIASAVISARIGINLGSLTDLGADLINRTFSRDQEREADQLGVTYMTSAGFDPQGAVRLQRALISVAKSTSLPFLSTHPSGDERIANIQQMINALPKSIAVAAPKPAESPAQEANTAAPTASASTITTPPLPYCSNADASTIWTNCVGTLTVSDGRKYVGEFRDGKRHGQGTLYGPNDTVLQTGAWENDAMVEGR